MRLSDSSDCLPEPGGYFENDLMAPHDPKLHLAQIREKPSGEALAGGDSPAQGHRAWEEGREPGSWGFLCVSTPGLRATPVH